MALDGVFLRHLKEEIGTSLLGTRVDRVFQPNRDELILAFRGFSAAYKPVSYTHLDVYKRQARNL